MITLLIIYWIFAGLICLGVVYQQSKLNFLFFMLCFIFGGILIPIKFGMVLQQITEILSILISKQ